MTEAKNPLATALGTYHPKHSIVAVFHDPSRAVEAPTALEGAGVRNVGVELCPGPEFLKNYRDFVEHRSILQRVTGAFASEEQAAVEQYLAEAERGASFVTVHTLQGEERDRAQNVLKAHGGHTMRYYGDYAISDLDER